MHRVKDQLIRRVVIDKTESGCIFSPTQKEKTMPKTRSNLTSDALAPGGVNDKPLSLTTRPATKKCRNESDANIPGSSSSSKKTHVKERNVENVEISPSSSSQKRTRPSSANSTFLDEPTTKNKAHPKSPENRTNNGTIAEIYNGELGEFDTHNDDGTKASSKPPPNIDVTVHRIRHLSFHPKPITTMQATLMSQKHNCVAISRDNGSVELKSVDQKFRTMATISGQRGKQVNVLAWLNGEDESSPLPLLVGGSRDGTIFIVDFTLGRFRKVISSGGGGVFALVSTCRRNTTVQANAEDNIIAAGCEDGSIRFFSVDRQNGFNLVAIIASSGAAVLSLAWRNEHRHGLIGSSLYVGVADGTIRRYDCQSKDGVPIWRPKLRMTVESLGRNIPTRIWGLQALEDSTIVSTDSLGNVQLWDGESGTLKQTFVQNDSKADVLALAISNDECKIYASGIDSRVVCIERPSIKGTTANYERKWILTHAQRPHTHDVKALAVVQQRRENGECLELLCSGGVDTKLCTYLVKDFQKRRPSVLYPWPTDTPVSLATGARILLMRREDCVDFYRLAPKRTDPVVVPELVPEEMSLGSVALKSDFNISCAAVSVDGRYLAISDSNAFLFFKLEHEGRSVIPSQITVDLPERAAILAMHFTSSSRLFLLSAEKKVYVLSLPQDNVHEVVGVEQVVTNENSPSDTKLFAGHHICCSEDCRWFATVSDGLEGGRVDIFRMQGAHYHHWWTLPSVGMSNSCVEFLPGRAEVAVGGINFEVYVFDLEQRCLSQWNESAGFPLSKKLPYELRSRSDYVVRLAINPAAPNKILVVSCFENRYRHSARALFRHEWP